MTHSPRVIVVGAGIAGVSAAFHLAVRHGVDDVVLVDPRPPLTLTSDKSTECYRNWWPDKPMVDLMNRSIDIYEDLAGETEFGLNRQGYLFLTAMEERRKKMEQEATKIGALGANAELLDEVALRQRFPFVTPSAVGGVLVERAGWFRAQDLGQWMLDRARQHGARLIPASVVSIAGTSMTLSSGEKLSADAVVLATGPMSQATASMVGIELPLFSELHLKVAFKDHLGVIPRHAPMTIWSDTQRLAWSEEERAELANMGRDDLLGEMPIYCHFRPEGGPDSPYFVALWEYHGRVLEPTWPLPEDPLYPEVVMRGLTTMIPGLDVYSDRLPESFVDGGYYIKTGENRPLIGPSGLDGIFLLAGFSGFGVMVAAGAADLLAAHLLGHRLPAYSDSFLLGRYQDSGYLAGLETAQSGQL